MENAETVLTWVIQHRGEKVVEIFLSGLAEKIDTEIVLNTLDHVIGGYYSSDDPEGYADSGENPEDIFAELIRKNRHAVRRERKISENKKHYAQICAKKGVV